MEKGWRSGTALNLIMPIRHRRKKRKRRSSKSFKVLRDHLFLITGIAVGLVVTMGLIWLVFLAFVNNIEKVLGK